MKKKASRERRGGERKGRGGGGGGERGRRSSRGGAGGVHKSKRNSWLEHMKKAGVDCKFFTLEFCHFLSSNNKKVTKMPSSNIKRQDFYFSYSRG